MSRHLLSRVVAAVCSADLYLDFTDHFNDIDVSAVVYLVGYIRIFLGFSAVLPIKPFQPSSNLVALNFFCHLRGRWTLYMSFAIFLVFLIAASHNDAFAAEKLETAKSYCTKIVVATPNRSISLGCQRPSQDSWNLEGSSLQRSSSPGSDSSTDRNYVGATVEVCTMQKDGKGQRSLLSQVRPALDYMCGWPCGELPCQLGLGRSARTYRYETAEDTKQICRSRTREWMEAECQRSKEATAWKPPRRQSSWERQRRSQRSRQANGWTNWIGCSLTVCNLSGFSADYALGAGGLIQQHRHSICDIEFFYSQQRAISCCCQSIPGQEPDAGGVARLGRQSQFAVFQVDHKRLAFGYEQPRQVQKTSAGSGGSEKSSQTSLDPSSCRIPRALAKTVTRLHATTGDIGRKRKQSHSRHTDGQQEYTKPQPASSGYRWPTRGRGTSAAQQSGSLHAEGQRDDRSPEETSKVLWRMHGGSRLEGGQRSCRGDLGIRRRRGAEEKEAKITRATGKCIVIQGRVSMCQMNRRHAGHVKFNPLVEAYGDNGKHHAAGYGFDVAITFSSVDFRFPTMPSPMSMHSSNEFDTYAFGLRANLTANCLRQQVLCDMYEDVLHRQHRVPERPEIPRHDPPDDPFVPAGHPPIVADPRVVIDEWGFLRDLLTQAEEVPTDVFILEMYGLFITHHSIRVQESGTSISEIQRTVQAAWEDVMPADSVAMVHCLKPQDSVRLSPLQVIVEIVPAGVNIPQNELPILYKVRRRSDGSLELRSAYMRDMQTGYETLIDAGAGDDCHPIYGYTCNVQIEGQVAILPQRHVVRPGSVVEIIIHDVPSHGLELDGTEHISLMQEALSLCRLPQSSATPQYFYDGDDAANYSWQQSAFICRDDGACTITQLRTTDELQEAIDLRSTSQDEATHGTVTAEGPVDPLLIIEDWEDLRVLLRDSPEEVPDEVAIVMYGLYQAHVGDRRSMSARDIHAVRECVFRTWEDFLLPGVTAFLHLVRPQEYLHQNEIHVIVEFSSPMVPLPNLAMPSLRRTIWHSVGADSPIVVAAYHNPGTNQFELLRGTGLFEWCGPDSRATCNVYIEKALLLPLAVARIQQGSLVEVFVHDILDSDTMATLQVSLAATHGVDYVGSGTGCIELGGLKENSASGTSDPCSCATRMAQRDPVIQELKPNHGIPPDLDGVVPHRQRTADGHVIIGRTLAPPNWQTNRAYRAAAESGSLFRDDADDLRVRVRSWIASVRTQLILPHRDFAIRAQLMGDLEIKLRRVWRDQIQQTDRVKFTVVRPSPNIGYTGRKPLHVLIELNRPHNSPLHPILIAHREINARGPVNPVQWIPVLVATPIGRTTLHNICAPPLPQ